MLLSAFVDKTALVKQRWLGYSEPCLHSVEVAAFVFPTTAECAEAPLPLMWSDTCLPVGLNEGILLFPLLMRASFAFFFKLNYFRLNHKCFHLSSGFCLFIIKYTFVSLCWQLKDFTTLLELALIMMKVQMGDCFLGLGIFIILLFSWLGTASRTRLLLCSIMPLSSFSSLLLTWLGICLGNWILPSSLM